MARVLIIEDNDEMRIVCRISLEAAGHLVDEAPNGAVALRRFREQQADVVVCDIFLPVMDGPETIAALLAQFPGTKIVAITGATKEREAFEQYALSLGAIGALAKPFGARQLVAAVEGALGGPA